MYRKRYRYVFGLGASLGLIISEGTQPSDDGQGYLNTPGIYTDAHVAGWRETADTIHAGGGYLFIQLMHVGRMSHPDNTPHHRQPVAPSAIAPLGQFALANPDVVERLKTGAPFNEPDPATYYGGDEKGYADYPTFDESDDEADDEAAA